MKRGWWAIAGVCVLGLAASMTFWQPEWLQRVVIDEATRRVDASTPYRLQIGAVRWSVLRGLRLEQIQLATKTDGVALLKASSLNIHLEWRPLLHRQIHFSHLTLRNPVLLIPFEDKDWLPSSENSSSSIPIVINRLDVYDGKILIRRHKDDTSHEVVLDNVDVQADLSSDALAINQLDFRMGAGHAHVKGDVALRPVMKARLGVDTEQLALEKFVLLLSTPPAGLRLTHSGHTVITAQSSEATIQTTGRLTGALLKGSLLWHRSGFYKTQLTLSGAHVDALWTGSPFPGAELSAELEASGRDWYPNVHGDVLIERPATDKQPEQKVHAWVQWSKGAGPIQLLAHYGALTAQATGQSNLRSQSVAGDFVVSTSSLGTLGGAFAGAQGTAQVLGHLTLTPRAWSVSGNGSAHDLLWQGHSLKTLQCTFHADTKSLDLHWNASDIHLESQQKIPWDIASLTGSLSGWRPLWKVSLSSTFQNHAKLDIQGRLAQRGDDFEFTSEQLQMNIAPSGLWQSPGPVYISWDHRKQFEIRNLILAQGSQHVTFNDFLWSTEQSRIDLSLHLDPSNFNEMLPEVEFSKGSLLDIQWKADGRGSALHSHGTFKGQADHMVIKTIGLALKHWTCDMRSEDKSFTIQTCTAEMPHGNLSLTGQSILPQLQIALHGDKVAIQYEKSIKGTATLALDLQGTLQAPELRGHINLIEATYTPPKKKKEATPPPTSDAKTSTSTPSLWRNTLLNVTAQWSRNVWYREGSSSIETRADLHVQKSKGESDWHLSGSITSLRGNYSYLGRNFSIDSGQLLFPDTVGFNPLFNITASYAAEAITIYLDITGSVQQPVVKLRSSPALSEQDIISVLAFGQPISQLRSTGGSSNQQMQAAAGSVLGSYLTDELQESGLSPISFDVMNVQTTSSGNQLTIGRYITRRLFVSYGQTMQTSPGRTVNGAYYLTDRWILEAQTGTLQGNYLDLLFRYPLNGNGKDSGSRLMQSPFRNTLDLPTTAGQPPLPYVPSR